ncbi:MAG: DUF3772 domain-containing protein [Pseudomonadota bacterium]
MATAVSRAAWRAGPAAALILVLGLAGWAIAPAPARAQAEGSDVPTAAQMQQDAQALETVFATWRDNAARVEDALAEGTASTVAFEVLREALAGDRAASRTLADRIAAALEPLTRELSALQATSDGPPASAEDGAADAVDAPPPPDAVAEDIRALQDRIDRLDASQRLAERAYARADALIGEIDDLVRARLADQLFSMGPSPLVPARWTEAAAEYADLGRRVVNEARYNARLRPAGGGVGVFVTLVAAAAAAAILAFVVRNRLITAVAAWAGPEPSRARRTAASGLGAVLSLITPGAAVALLSAAVDASGLLGPAGRALAPAALGSLIFAVLARGLSQAFFSARAPTLRIAAVGDEEAVRGARAVVLLILGVMGHGIFVGGARDAGLSPSTLSLANAVWVTVTAFGLWRLTRFLIRSAPASGLAAAEEDAAAAPAAPSSAEDDAAAQSRNLGRRLAATGVFALRFVALAATLLAWIGFVEASDRLLISPILTLGLAVLGILLFHLISDGVEAYIEGRGAPAEGVSDGLRLIPPLVIFLLGCAALPLVALIWGARLADVAEAWSLVVDGVDVGGVSISPINILTFVVVFGIGYSLTRLLQTVLATSVLPKTRMDAGGRSAVVSGLGYVGFGLAALVAVSAVGLNLSNLAIVAGALSVGIGFGLQTIVNNFVSGIILLIERPIKVGDWIEVGGTNGTVRRVSVRATQIETFDRSALIVPNSELISGRVVNYTHGNSLGRVIIKVGVAYGTDTRKVERVLREIVSAEKRALQYPPPHVLFMGFGADSLDFEIRLILRDILTILAVTSDTHHEINRRFVEEGIEIPFAQRVMHVAEPERLAAALRAGAEGAAAGGEVAANGDASAAPAPGPQSLARSAAGDPGPGEPDPER